MGTIVRLAGRITDWNDDKGYGFVVPNGGGDRAFVHVSEFQRGSRRPVAGDLVSYLPAKDQRGRINAREVRHAGRNTEVPRTPRRRPGTAIGTAALLVAVILAVVGLVPMVVAGVVLGLSGLAFLMYWLDKSAAQGGRQRIPESTLHLVALAGGWPGALVAQQVFRHKTIKQPFQAVFWGTVVLNVAALVWFVGAGAAVFGA